MSLRHALLGLLAREPASGYDLARTFEGDLGRWAWQAGHTRIYPELVTMAGEGLLDVETGGARGRKTYAITDRGRGELRDWMIHWPEQATVRDETVLRLFLIPSLDPADAREVLDAIVTGCERGLAELRPLMQEVDTEEGTGSWPPPFGRLAGEYGIGQFEATLAWARWASEQLPPPEG